MLELRYLLSEIAEHCGIANPNGNPRWSLTDGRPGATNSHRVTRGYRGPRAWKQAIKRASGADDGVLSTTLDRACAGDESLTS